LIKITYGTVYISLESMCCTMDIFLREWGGGGVESIGKKTPEWPDDTGFWKLSF
jgi:hypothetical protein